MASNILRISVRLFLPFRWLCHCYMDTSFLLEALARSPNDGASIHPALLNAICLVACCLAGGRLFTFKDYFLKQTRFHLEQSLEHVDWLTHFLWANVVLGNYLTNCGRLEESSAVVSAAARSTLACGLYVDGITRSMMGQLRRMLGCYLLLWARWKWRIGAVCLMLFI